MRVALAQINPVTGDLRGNLQKVIEWIRVARKKRAELIIFPEMALTGYCISDLVEDDLFIKTNKDALREIAKEAKDSSVIIGFVDYDEDKRNNDGRLRKYNAAALLQNNQIIGIVHKSLLPNYRYFDDKRYFASSEERKPFTVTIGGKKVSLGISICEDMWDQEYDIKPIKELASKGAKIIININASPFSPNKIDKREEVIKKHICDTGLPVIYVNTVGAADNGKNIIPFDGQSLVYNNKGDLIAIGKQFEEELVLVDLDDAKKIQKPVSCKEKELFNALVMSVRDYAKKTGFKKAILPLSGGIDSALGLVITVEALGKENVVAYNLPSKFNTNTTKEIAATLAKNLGIKYKVIPIQKIDDTVQEIFIRHAHIIESKAAKENLHARIRGLLMMLESNDTNSLLISNGNKTEIALGYSTLYGDMCGGISVIGDLSKTEVYALSRYVNEKYKKEIIPNETFTIKPSAELSEGQYDPFDYEIVSPLVEELVELREAPKNIIVKFRNKTLSNQFNKRVYKTYTLQTFEDLVYHIHNLLRRSVYKRLQGPPIIVVTERAFGFDLRETLVNQWGGR